MRIYKEKVKSVIIAFLMVLSLGLLSSCQKDALQDDSGTLAPDECLITFSIPENVKQEITSRSSNDWAETYIGNLFVLCFDDQRQYQSGDIISIGSNPTGTVSVSTKAIKGTKGFVVLLANSTKYTTTADLDAGMKNKTIDDINTLFLDSWSGFAQKPTSLNTMGKDMPMSSIVHEYTERPKAISLDLIHSFAKLHVLYDSGIASNDKTGLFSGDTRGHSFRVMPCPKTGYTNIFRDKEEQISSPASSSDFVEPTDKVYIHIDHGLVERTFYLPEYPNEHYAKGALVDSTKWHKDRICIILEATDGGSKTQFFRLDFCKKATDGTYEFLDIERNKHIRFLIKAVKSNGYATVEEALAAPASNIEYTIEVDRESDVVTSNGQYALCLSNDAKIIKGGKGTYDVANVRYQVAEGIDLSVLESRSSVTTNLSSMTNAKLVFNGVQITQGMSAPPTIVSGNNIIQLETGDNAQEADCEVYLSFGTLKDTIVVKRYPYNDEKIVVKLNSALPPKTIWDKNDAKVSVSADNLTIPYRIQKVDAYAVGAIAGDFQIGTSATAPRTTRLSVDITQKAIDGYLTTFFTNQANGQLFIDNVFTPATLTDGIQKILVSGQPAIKVQAQNFKGTDNKFYIAKEWKHGNTTVPGSSSGDDSYVTALTGGSGLELIVPYAKQNEGDYTAIFDAVSSYVVKYKLNAPSLEEEVLSPPAAQSKIPGQSLTLSDLAYTATTHNFQIVGWSLTPMPRIEGLETTDVPKDILKGGHMVTDAQLNNADLSKLDVTLYAVWQRRKVQIELKSTNVAYGSRFYYVGAGLGYTLAHALAPIFVATDFYRASVSLYDPVSNQEVYEGTTIITVSKVNMTFNDYGLLLKRIAVTNVGMTSYSLRVYSLGTLFGPNLRRYDRAFPAPRPGEQLIGYVPLDQDFDLGIHHAESFATTIWVDLYSGSNKFKTYSRWYTKFEAASIQIHRPAQALTRIEVSR